MFSFIFHQRAKKEKEDNTKRLKNLTIKNYFSDANTVFLMIITSEGCVSCDIEFLGKLMLECKSHYKNYLCILITQFSPTSKVLSLIVEEFDVGI